MVLKKDCQTLDWRRNPFAKDPVNQLKSAIVAARIFSGLHRPKSVIRAAAFLCMVCSCPDGTVRCWNKLRGGDTNLLFKDVGKMIGVAESG